MCNCMNRGCSDCHEHASFECGNQCFSLGPFRASNSVCPPINTGSIIPFSSGSTATILTTDATGAAATVSAIGIGTAATGIIPATDGTITLPVGSTEPLNIPRAGTISAISATFTETAGVTLAPAGSTATITARVYRAPAGSSIFTPTNAFVNLTPTVTGTVAPGTVFQGTTSANVPVLAGDRLVLIFSVAGTATALTLSGPATASITIS